MSGFKYKHSEVLSLVLQAKKEDIITDEEKKTIKDFIITKEPDLDLDLDQYFQDKDLRKLVETLKLLSGITSMSSPVDSNLIVKKKRKQQAHKEEIVNVKKMDKKANKAAKEENFDFEECDIGASPTINFKKKFDRDDDSN